MMDDKVLSKFGESRGERNWPEVLVYVGDMGTGIGTTSANFQEAGHLCSAKMLFKMEATGRVMISAYSLKNQLGIPSGPAAFRGFRSDKDDKTAD